MIFEHGEEEEPQSNLHFSEPIYMICENKYFVSQCMFSRGQYILNMV